jgi:hypothetical protein
MSRISDSSRILAASVTECTFISDETEGPVDATFALLAHAGTSLEAGRLCTLLTCYGDVEHWRAALRRLLGPESDSIAVLSLSSAAAGVADGASPAARAQSLLDTAIRAAEAAAGPKKAIPCNGRAWFGIDDVFGFADAWGLSEGVDCVRALVEVARERNTCLSLRAAPDIDWMVDLGGGENLGASFRSIVAEIACGTLVVDTISSGSQGGRLRWLSSSSSQEQGGLLQTTSLFKITIDGKAADAIV